MTDSPQDTVCVSLVTDKDSLRFQIITCSSNVKTRITLLRDDIRSKAKINAISTVNADN